MLTGEELRAMLAAMREFGVVRFKQGDLEIQFGREWPPIRPDDGTILAPSPYGIEAGDPGIDENPADAGTEDLGLTRDDIDFAHTNGMPAPTEGT